MRANPAGDQTGSFFRATPLDQDMGFGSYDESEQQNQDVGAEDEESEGVRVHENEHEGTVTYESEATTDALLDQLAEIKRDAEGA